MALSQCFDCGGPVSTRAAACPRCGCPVEMRNVQTSFDPIVAEDRPNPVVQQPQVAEIELVEPIEPLKGVSPRPSAAQSLTASIQRMDPPAFEVPKVRWRTSNPAAWSRYLARTLDILLFVQPLSLCLWGLASLMLTPERFQEAAANSFLTGPLSGIGLLVLIIPLNAAFIGWSGSSPGKFLFGVKVLDGSYLPIGLKNALGREVLVYLQGLGMGVPIVSLFTQIAAYKRVTNSGTAAWDESDGYVCLYRNHTWGTRLLWATGLLLILVGLMIAAALRAN